MLLESCFHASASIMPLCICIFLLCFHIVCLFLFGCLDFILFCFQNKNKKEKLEKYKNNVFVYIGICVPWMAIKTKFSKLCIVCSLDEHLYA